MRDQDMISGIREMEEEYDLMHEPLDLIENLEDYYMWLLSGFKCCASDF